MAVKKKIKLKRKRTPVHPDTRGMFFLISGFLIFLSLYSFIAMHPHKNWLGILGYAAAWGLVYLFGLAAILIPIYLVWLAVCALRRKVSLHPGCDHVYFLVLLSSASFLFTVSADRFPSFAEQWKDKAITEKAAVFSPYPRTVVRHNLGGVPFYFLYADLSPLNLRKILSPSGCVLIFSCLGLVAFFLLTRLSFARGALVLWKGSWFTAGQIKTILQRLWQRSEEKRLAMRLQKPRETKAFVVQDVLKKAPPAPKAPAAEEPIIQPVIRRESVSVPSPAKKESIAIPTQNLIVHADRSFKLPSPGMLSSPSHRVDPPALKKDLLRQAAILEETLKSFGIEAKVGEIHSGPTITSFEVHPSIGVKVQKIKTLENDIALNMQAKSIRIVAPIPGKAAVGVEIPAIHPQEVNFKEMLLHYQQKGKKLSIPILLGKAINGDWVFSDLARMPHLLIAGATGSGKSVCVNTIVLSILMNARPEEVKLLMIDPKKVELTQYSKLPHMIAPVITEPHGAYSALQWLVKEMQVRYEILKQLGVRNISAFNSRRVDKELEASLGIPIPEQMPFIVAIVDEFADLMMVSSNDIETPIARIAQMARAVGIHLILATQRPSREVITGIIKANIPTRISFKVASRINSQIILDDTGAENLLGNGDLLFLPPGSSQLLRAQGAYLSDDDINQVVKFLSAQGEPQYMIPSFDALRSFDIGADKEESKGNDPLYDQALTTVISSKNASTTFLQRKLKIGYARAASLMDELEANGVIGPAEGAKPRRVLGASQMAPLSDDDEDL